MRRNTGGIRNLILMVMRHNDLILAFLVVAIIALMILPMPPPLVDALLATNLGISVTLLMVSMYIPSALSLSTFPSLLLFTTLFRLALGITTTRLILIHAYAGEIILTFGNFVVAGNFVVGAVVFLIITIVQFLVITKGAERVSEVGARFTLDAMPGKQMSIDADMRAGTIELDEAKRRRTAVEKESQLYGAMDGAMKFVKGDAIAGLIITVVNILGGLTIGVLQKGMPLAKAVKTYSILTIGDGLVTQIPALFISIAAGIIVTRVSTEDSPNLGADIGAQILAQPKALLIGGVLLVSFSLVPGFPKAQFIVLGLAVGLVGFIFFRSAREAAEEEPGIPALAPAGKKAAPRPSRDEEFSLTVPLMLDVAADLQEHLTHQALNDELVKIRKALYFDLGVPFPGIHLRFSSLVEKGTYTILLQEIPMAGGELKPGMVLVREDAETLKAMGIPITTAKKFLPDIPSLWADASFRDQLSRMGIPFMEPEKILTHHISFILKRHADEFVGLQEVKYLMDKMEAGYSELVKEAQRVLPVQKITEVLQRLVQEEITIRNLRAIFSALIEWGQKEKDVVLLTEYVRMSLKRYISYKYAGGQNILAVYLFDPGVEETVRKSIRQTSSGSYLALEPRTSKALVDAVKAQIGDLARARQKPVLLTSMDIRRYVKKLIELEIPSLTVLSYQELTQEITIQPLGRIRI